MHRRQILIPNQGANGSAMQALINCVRLGWRISYAHLQRRQGDGKAPSRFPGCQKGFVAANSALQPASHDGARWVSGTAAPEQLSCSFCGKSQHEARSLIEGACRNRGISQCIFICDECVEFCAQINADTVGSASSQQGRATP
jgi:ClpX C4-type zinc finger